MSNAKIAIDNIKRLAVTFQGLIEFAKDLEHVETLEGHILELQTDRSKLMEQNEKSVQDLIQANASIEKAKLEADQIIADAKAKSDQMIAEMVQNKNNMLAAAEKEVEESKSKMQATQIEFVKQYGEAENQLAELKLMIEEDSNRLAAIKEQIAKLKSL